MKIIISRKGFDNANGKCASPILPDGDMVSMPIPTEESSGLKFEEIFYQGRTYAQMWKELSEKAYYLYPSGFCHLDPDIREDVRSEKIPGWKPAFGQTGAAQGYLQVGEIITDPSRIKREYPWHPHSRFSDKNNVLYIPADKLTINGEDQGVKGYGVLNYDKKRVLTKEGHSKGKWIKRAFYMPENVAGNRKNSSQSEDALYYAGIWQQTIGADLYLTGINPKDNSIHRAKPCPLCARTIIQAGIRNVYLRLGEGMDNYAAVPANELEWVQDNR